MKITKEALKSMDFVQQKNNNGLLIDTWHLKIQGYIFIIKGGPSFWDFYPPATFHSHSVTDIEELLGFTFDNGFKSGKRECKRKLRKFLGIK